MRPQAIPPSKSYGPQMHAPAVADRVNPQLTASKGNDRSAHSLSSSGPTHSTSVKYKPRPWMPRVASSRAAKLRVQHLYVRWILERLWKMVASITIEPIRFNSRCITFPDWISLITLCLAPLIAHVVSGAPQPSYLTDRRPRWYDYMCIYNPTSIIWRYAAITDRRIRAKNWSREDFAASNAIFWTSNGWDGGEHMGPITAAYCLRCPQGTHTALFSLTMFKTVITTLQGVAAVYLLMSALAIPSLPTVSSIGFGIDTVFFPLAILGLLRLCAAAWLTEDYVYQDYAQCRSSTLEMGSLRSPKSDTKDTEINVHESRNGLEPLLVSQSQSAGFKSPAESWGSRIFRFCFLCLMWAVWLLALFCALPLNGVDAFYTMTFFLLDIFYLLFATVTAITYTIFFFKGMTTNTIIPCVASTWYRIYTLLFTGLMMGLIAVAAIETNKGPDGLYTSWNPIVNLGCVGREDFWWLIPQTRFLGLASNVEFDKEWLTRNQTGLTAVAEHGTNISAPETFWLYNFTGYCVGRINDV